MYPCSLSLTRSTIVLKSAKVVNFSFSSGCILFFAIMSSLLADCRICAYNINGNRVFKTVLDKGYTLFSTIPYADVTAALDYYFENYNNGRPFIIAGHSQGSGIVSLVLKDYFKKHTDYYERMIAAYVIGFSITKDYLEENPHLKFANGEYDTGVIISWNTEGPKNEEQNVNNVVILPNAISINPLNWKLDETYAPASKNLGSRILNEKTVEYEIKDVGADAKLVLSRGSILTNAHFEPVGGDAFGPQSYHNGDYALYYNNIKENVAKRIESYKANH